ncbi:MAG: O-antigen polysaccharide polymerase Wzy [Gemmatimonadota bacterium]
MIEPRSGRTPEATWTIAGAAVASTILGTATGLAGLAREPGLCAAAAILSSFAFLRLCVASQRGNVASLVGVFCCFHILYGLSGPLAVMLGADLTPVFLGPYAPVQFLTCYGIATAGFSLGLSMTVIGDRSAPDTANRWRASPSALGATAVLVAFSSSVMEVVNVMRAGGPAILLEGKAAYQGAIADLGGTLPSDLTGSAAAALMGLAVGLGTSPRRRRARSHVIWFLLGLAPLLAAALILGRRGLVVNWIVSGLLGYSFAGPPVRLRRSFVAATAAVYLALGVVYANRSFVKLAIGGGDWLQVAKATVSPERILVALNPAANEFGAPFGNFSTYVQAGPQPLALGTTYVRSLILPIPRWVYPGPKPPQVGVEFRDRFFPLVAGQGSIAGTAYSSILEGYVNFGIAGLGLVYCILAIVLGRLERWRRTRPAPAFGVFYALLGSGVIAFHRSDFADSLVITAIFGGALAFAVWVVLEVLSFGAARTRPREQSDSLGVSRA